MALRTSFYDISYCELIAIILFFFRAIFFRWWHVIRTFKKKGVSKILNFDPWSIIMWKQTFPTTWTFDTIIAAGPPQSLDSGFVLENKYHFYKNEYIISIYVQEGGGRLLLTHSRSFLHVARWFRRRAILVHSLIRRVGSRSFGTVTRTEVRVLSLMNLFIPVGERKKN
jgi:hypothetical protein